MIQIVLDLMALVATVLALGASLGLYRTTRASTAILFTVAMAYSLFARLLITGYHLTDNTEFTYAPHVVAVAYVLTAIAILSLLRAINSVIPRKDKDAL